ncbi:MAG: peptidoglycan-binding protein, partial [Cyanobacteria bacterium REEB65]|nr:peptidoglycan-binding protein [Cyanobacteria bacterium REEB65]
QTGMLNPGVLALHRGEAGPRVSKLHAELTELGFLPKGDLSAYFGVSTDAAVQAFQRSCGLVADGVIDAGTQHAIDDSLAKLRSGLRSRARCYRVRPGDTLLRLALLFLGDANRWREILALNNLADPSRVVPGLVLRIPPRT